MNSAAQACQCSGDRHSGQEHLVGVDSAVLSGALAETDCPELITQSRLADDEPYEDGCCNSDDDTPVGCGTAGSCLDKFRREDAGRICHVRAGLTASDSPDGFQVYDVVGKVEGDPVEHDIGKHFIDASFYLQETDDNAPESSRCHSCHNAEKNVERGRQMKDNTDHAGCDGTHNELSLSSDVENAGPEREGNAQSGEDQRRCIHNAPGDIFHLTENAV